MLLKYTKTSATGAGSSTSTSTTIVRGTGMRMTMSTASTMTPRIHRKGFRTPSKRHPGKALPGKLHSHSVSRIGPGKMVPGKRIPQRPHPPPCDNSNDSGFGFDQHVEVQQPQQQSQNASSSSNSASSSTSTNISNNNNNNNNSTNNSSNNNNNSSSYHPHTHHHVGTVLQHSPQQHMIRAIPTARFMSASTRNLTRVAHKRQPATVMNSMATSSNGHVQLEIVSQPEQQHRARYQTEGSRGAVKDRSGNSFPIVRLNGYNKHAILQVFIGTDVGRVAPHMFYQACKVAGKNSTQCNEKKMDGTMVIEIDFKPESDMTITCDCVGILKERNVDVEHRFPDHHAQKNNKKKSTRCRMVFRTQLTNDDGSVETLQVCSNPIICTQPPGVPEICKKSLNSCPVDGGLELFIIGKNFLKDTHVIFQESYDSPDLEDPTSEMVVRQRMMSALWEQTVLPDKEYLQQTHLICTVPPYLHQNIVKPVTVQVSIVSSGKKSESHSFIYTPKGSYTTLAAATTLSSTLHGSLSTAQDVAFMDTSTNSLAPAPLDGGALWPGTETKHEIDSGMMPPPISTQMPMGVRRPSLPTNTPMITDQQLVHLNAVAAADVLKTELLDESSQNSLADTLHSPEAVGVCGPHSPTSLQYHTRYARKASLDAMMYETNSLPAFPVPQTTAASSQIEVDAVAAAVEFAVKNEIAKEILQQQQQQQQQAVATVDKFINDLTGTTNVVPVAPAVTEQSLFGVNNAAAVAIDHAFSDMLQQAAVSNTQQSGPGNLSLSSSSSSLSSASNSSSPLSVGGGNSSPHAHTLLNHNSPIPSEMLMNTEPAVTLNGLTPIPTLIPNAANTAAVVNSLPLSPNAASAALTNDIIMNPSVSPSTILCSSNGAAAAVVPNIMAPHQVTMANSILNDIAMQPQPTQQDAAVAALALSNIIMTPQAAATGVSNGVVAATPAAVQPEVTAATSTAVGNMLIKAAADFISTQEQQTHQQQQQLINGNTVNTPAAGDPLVNLLLNHHEVAVSPTAAASAAVAAAAAAAGEVQTQFPIGIPSPTQQESLIVTLTTENASVAAAAVTTNGAVVTQQTPTTSTGLHAAAVGAVAAAAAVPLPPPIPQELTTMSDQDLISYINPSTFDQI